MMSSRFSEGFRNLRQRSGVSKSELARRAGVARRTLGYWESGERLPRNTELEGVLNALAVDSAARAQLMALLPTPRSVQMVREESRSGDAPAQELGPLPEIGDLLRAMRVRRGWTQEEMAAELGAKRFTVLRWETTQHFPSEANLERICRLLQAYPEEKQALQARRLNTQFRKAVGSLEGCEAEVIRFVQQVHRMESPLIDLNALALKRRLHLLTGDSEEAVRLLAQMEIEHGTWLMFHDRAAESRECVWRALGMVQNRFKPERFWVNALNLATMYRKRALGTNESAFQLLKEWLPLLTDSPLQTYLFCDMALYAGLSDQNDTAMALLKEAQRASRSSDAGDQGTYLRLTSARVRMRALRTVEDLEWLLETAVSSSQRLSYLVMWVETLIGAGARQAALRYLTQAQAECNAETAPRLQRQVEELSYRI